MSAANGVDLFRLGHDVVQYDLMYDGEVGRASGYVIGGAVPTLVETGPGSSVACTLAALDVLQIARAAVQYVIVTHIHLDHAGGVGLLLQSLPQAKVVVHPRGARHLIDPVKLIASAREVYGTAFTRLFDPIVPVPAERVIEASDGMTLMLEERKLTLFDTPGHARHHIIVFDERSRGIFSGDAIGLTYPAVNALGQGLFFPTSSPTQFEPEAMKATLRRMADLAPEVIYFTHYGCYDQAVAIIERNYRWVDAYVELAQRHYDRATGWTSIADPMRQMFYDELRRYGVDVGHPALAVLEGDLELNAKGLAYMMEHRP